MNLLFDFDIHYGPSSLYKKNVSCVWFFFSKANDDSTKNRSFRREKCKNCNGTLWNIRSRPWILHTHTQKTHQIRIIYDIKDRTHSNCTSKLQQQHEKKRHTHSNYVPLCRMIKCASHDNITLQKKHLKPPFVSFSYAQSFSFRLLLIYRQNARAFQFTHYNQYIFAV